MTVKEFIEKLQKYDQKKEVLTRTYDSFGKFWTVDPILEEYNNHIFIN